MTKELTGGSRKGAASGFLTCQILALVVLGLLSGGCAEKGGLGEPEIEEIAGSPFQGFPAVPVPADNPITPAKVELGRFLFFDTRFSKDSSISCASCHKQEGAFSDAGNSTSEGFSGERTTRNAPGLSNVAYNTSLFWDGGVPSLEIQAIAPIINPIEMGMNTDTLLLRLMDEPRYVQLFSEAWGDSHITLERVTKSVASFERTLLTGSSPYDAWNRGDDNAISESAKRGVGLFFGEKGDCFHCHGGFNFTDNQFHNTGLDSVTVDEGRYRLTNNIFDMAKFRTPTLRNIAISAPYMHDGRFFTLDEVVRHYNSGGKDHPLSDVLIRPLGLSETDIKDLVSFLETLTDQVFIQDPNLQDPWNP